MTLLMKNNSNENDIKNSCALYFLIFLNLKEAYWNSVKESVSIDWNL